MQPWNADAETWRKARHARSDVVYRANDLVPGYQRTLLWRELLIDHVQIGAANCASVDVHEHPVLAGLMTVFLLSLGGFPPLAGFIAKWYVFSAAVKAGYTGLAILGVLTSVVSVFFYLRIVVMMYMTPNDSPQPVPAVPRMAGAALIVSAILIFYLGILPTRVLDWAASSVLTIF